MYTPKWFKEERLEVLHGAIERVGFGTLVTTGPSGLLASHIPMMVERSEGPLGTLLGHIARGNPQWRETASGSLGLAMFVGPDAYISPSWYETTRATGKVVPTWNYIAVHARGVPEFFDDSERLLELVKRLTDHFEDPTGGWKVADAPTDYIASQLKAIVGFRMRLKTLDGKWKMGQNRSAPDRVGAIEGLRRRGEKGDSDVAEEMQSALDAARGNVDAAKEGKTSDQTP